MLRDRKSTVALFQISFISITRIYAPESAEPIRVIEKGAQ